MDDCNSLTSANVFNMWSHDYDSSLITAVCYEEIIMASEGSHFASLGEPPPV